MSNGPLEQLLAPQTQHARQRAVPGVVTAIVQSIEAEGLYRLQYLHCGDEQPSAPARAMMPMAGDRAGMHFLPDVGDEVVVGFEMGDSNFPIILGSVWNQKNSAPSQAKASPENHVRTIVSRSGHELTLDDTPGEQKVTLKTQGGHELVLDDLPGLGGVKLSTKLGCSLTLTDLPVPAATLQVPGATIQVSPTGVTIQALTINLASVPGGLALEGKPFLLHTHLSPATPPAPSFTGPVSPV
jgi:phage baseplate assembly protein gpV